MPISNKRFTEIRFMISDLIQRKAWDELYENCGTNDLDLAKSVANIFSMFDPKHVWQFVDHVLKIPPDTRRERRDSTLTVALAIGRIGRDDPEKALRSLRTLLSDDHMLRTPVEASLANLWVYDRKTTENHVLNSWIQSNHENDDLQEIGVRSCDYLYSQDPKHIEPFLEKVLRLNDAKYRAAQNAAKEIALKYEFGKKLLKDSRRRVASQRVKKKKHRTGSIGQKKTRNKKRKHTKSRNGKHGQKRKDKKKKKKYKKKKKK
jgi:hypothetical protein